MKKLTLILTISVIIFTSFFISCKKEQTLKEIISNEKPTNAFSKEPIKIGCEKFLTDYCLECHQYCTEPGVNCLPCVTVTPNQKSSPIDCLYALVDASTNEIVLFFNNEDNYRNLLPYLLETKYSNFLKALRSGNYYFSKTIQTDQGRNVIFVATNVTNRHEMAIPIGIIQ